MKLKLTIVLIAVLLRVAAGSICNPLSEVKTKRTYIRKSANYFKGDDINAIKQWSNNFGKEETLVIQSMIPGKMVLDYSKEQNDTLDRYFLFSNFVCYPHKGVNYCLLQYLTMDDNGMFFILREIKFQYNIAHDPSCEKNLRDGLSQKTCEIGNTQKSPYHIYYLPVYENNVRIKFDTKIRKFIFRDVEGVERNNSVITFDDRRETATLMINEVNYFTIKRNESCFFILEKIDVLLGLEKCTINDNTFKYFRLTKTDNTDNDAQNIPQEGDLEMTNNNIIINVGGAKKEFVFRHVEPESSTVYEQYYLKIGFSDKVYSYQAYINLNSKGCFERIKNLLIYYQSNTGSTFLNY
jgi:hypothetical protein